MFLRCVVELCYIKYLEILNFVKLNLKINLNNDLKNIIYITKYSKNKTMELIKISSILNFLTIALSSTIPSSSSGATEPPITIIDDITGEINNAIRKLPKTFSIYY